MREILFRGKRVDNGEWVCGDLVRHYENQRVFILTEQLSYTTTEYGISRIVSERYFEIIPKTVGQYTGMQDRNGNKIFEGDRIAFVDFLNGWETECIGEVIFSEFGWHFTDSITESNMYCYESEYVEIIGNIHDGEEDEND